MVELLFRFETVAPSVTTNGIGGRVGPTSNGAEDQSQRADQILDLASLVSVGDRGAALAVPGPSGRAAPASGTASATATAPAAALRSSLRAAPWPYPAPLPSTRHCGLSDGDKSLFNLSFLRGAILALNAAVLIQFPNAIPRDWGWVSAA